jgi:glycerol-3-phosphate acyltransferase PlsY
VTGVAALLGAYLVGAVPVGFLVARAFGGTDIRRQGSGTIGATNVLRTLGWLPAILTLVGDIAKGFCAVSLAAALLHGDDRGVAAAAVLAVVGNCWPVFLGFRGGKGVATGLGALLALIPWAMVPALLVFLAVVTTSRYVSLGSLLGAVGAPFAAMAIGYPTPSVLAALAIAGIIVARHRHNVLRLASGTEPRLGGHVSA